MNEDEHRRTHAARLPLSFSGLRGVLLVAVTYVYFLIFAQFGFLARLAELHLTDDRLKLVMAAMALGGIAVSLLAPRVRWLACPQCRLRGALLGCAVAALLSLLTMNASGAIAVAGLIGLSLGLLTVTLVAHLPLWIGQRNPLARVALGTGLGYFLCNVPALFTASPGMVAMASAACCLAGVFLVGNPSKDTDSSIGPELRSLVSPVAQKAPAFLLVLAWFTALIWLDSAAFYIIQHAPQLKAGTWQGDPHLWRAGLLHLVAALLSAWMLARRGLVVTLATALGVLGAACLLLAHPIEIPLAALLYPVGVSLYSVALVAYPSLLMVSVDHAQTARRAGYLYALAGWFGSAMGIGMAQHLMHIPPAFVVCAALLFAVPMALTTLRAIPTQAATTQAGNSQPGTAQARRSTLLPLLAIPAVLAASWGIYRITSVHVSPRATAPDTSALTAAIARGRRVYIAEGCIHCHSQYVRPNTADVLMWGPASDVEAIRREQPPLIGNRRQGPDLSQVGARRSSLWLRIHFYRPRDISYQSPMPSYAYLFTPQSAGHNTRGDDLIAYLLSLGHPGPWNPAATAWQPSAQAWGAANRQSGETLFQHSCATCHLLDGTARRKWSASFHRLPPNLFSNPLPHFPASMDEDAQRIEIARIVKFGLPRTDMAGHEYLPDAQIAALAEWLVNKRQANSQTTANSIAVSGAAPSKIR